MNYELIDPVGLLFNSAAGGSKEVDINKVRRKSQLRNAKYVSSRGPFFLPENLTATGLQFIMGTIL